MSEKMVDVTMHIDEETSQQQREDLRDHLLQREGVLAAAFQEKQPHLMVIEYDPDVAKSADFIEVAQSSGLHAELIGM